MLEKFQKSISIVIPLFNEEDNIEVLYESLIHQLEEIKGISSFQIIFVNDGSSDSSLNIIKNLKSKDNRVEYLSFSKNFGHQTALKAGLDHAHGKAVISMDADLQHPVEMIPKLIQEWEQGFDIVYTIREEDEKLSWFKRKTSKQFYKLINKLSQSKIEPGAADFRLLDQKIVALLRTYNEPNLFLRGIIPTLGFKQKGIIYKANDRFKGKTKYSFKKMMQLAINGITSLSAKPLYTSIYFGAFFAFLSFIYGIYAIIIKAFTEEAIDGWTSIVASILFIGGIQLIVLGLIGIYLGKLFIDSKNRPNYILSENSFHDSNK